jgi:hypothetical protein
MSVEQFAEGRLWVYAGDRRRGFRTFSVVDLPLAELEEHGVGELFREASRQRLEANSG